MKNNYTEIFAGSDIETNYIASILSDNGINYIIENTLSNSISAGWVNGTPYCSTTIKVIDSDIRKAKEIIDEYLKQHK